VAAGRRSDGMALFAPLCHFAGLIGSHEATVFTAVEDGHGANNWLLAWAGRVLPPSRCWQTRAVQRRRRAVSQNVNPLPQMINQQFRASVQAVSMSPRHLNHFELGTETPRPTVVAGRVKGHRHLERCRKISRHCN
jgi:hypothetical protein